MGAAESKEGKIQFVQHTCGQSEESMSGSITFFLTFLLFYTKLLILLILQIYFQQLSASYIWPIMSAWEHRHLAPGGVRRRHQLVAD